MNASGGIQRTLRVILAGLIMSALACSKHAPESTSETSADLISNRPIAYVPDLAVVTLPSPALLQSATMSPSGLVISEEAKKAVLKEQSDFEQLLKSINPQAKIVYKYRLTLNAVAIFAPAETAKVLMAMPGVRSVVPARQMGRPTASVQGPAPGLTSSTNSVSFIGGDRAKLLGFTGKGLRIGVIDTGVDYTHSMLGGHGDKAEYAAIDPKSPSPLFPNNKIVGGVDLVGTDFNAASPFGQFHLPVPDSNPLDEAGHGTHVAGTIAGVGDNRKTYNGVAPEAQIYAVKVFGKDGSTGDAVVIAGFEYAADPNGDLDPSDRLDVINLSLGGGYGQPQVLYSEAAKNLTRAGTIVVASAGNSGPVDYIVGAPSTSDDAFSIAASVDGSPHNWQFAASVFTSPDGSRTLAKAIEGPISKPVAEIGDITGPLVFIGLADKDLSEDLKTQLNGKVALILRGKVPFAQKIKRALEAGAIGVVMINTEAGDKTIPMGGDGHFDIPAIMIGRDLGTKIQQDMAGGEVTVEFKTLEKIFEPNVIDTITDFSSKGPRSEDNLLKPEIAAPGQAIVSAAMGEGRAGVEMSGTSMAGPHMAGVMALLRQAHPGLSVAELKAMAMETSRILSTDDGPVPLTLQGAGRVQLDKALEAKLVIQPSALSLGRVQVGSPRREVRTITLKNISNEDLELTTQVETNVDFQIRIPGQLTVPAHSEIQIIVEADVSLDHVNALAAELDAQIHFLNGGQSIAHLPALAIATQASLIQAQAPTSEKLILTNSSPLGGLAVAFNLLGEDVRKVNPVPSESWKSRSCDLQSAGYRIITRANDKGQPEEVLQVGFKLYTPLTTWSLCEVTALIDSDGDGNPDQELGGTAGGSVEGTGESQYVSVLLDAAKARTQRLAYENEIAKGNADAAVDYTPAIQAMSGMAAFPQSTLAVIEAPLKAIAKGLDGSIHLKLAALGSGGDMVESDDFLGQDPLGEWLTIAAKPTDQAYVGLPELVAVDGRTQSALTYQRGSGKEKLVLYYPHNEMFVNGNEGQSQTY